MSEDDVEYQESTKVSTYSEVLKDLMAEAKAGRIHRYGSPRPGVVGSFQALQGVQDDINWATAVARGRSNLDWNEMDDSMPEKSTPWFTYSFIVVTFLLLVMMCWDDMAPLSENPLVGPNTAVLLRFGALHTEKAIVGMELWRWVTTLFLYDGFLSWFWYSLALWAVASAYEQVYTTWHIPQLAFAMSLMTSIAQAAFEPFTISTGASSCVFAIYGSMLGDIVLNWKLLEALWWVLLEVLCVFLVGLSPFVDNYSHVVAGFLGFVSTVLVQPSYLFDLHESTKLQRRCMLAARIVIFTIWFLFQCWILYALLYPLHRDGLDAVPMHACPWCDNLNCVPMPFWSKKTSWWDCDGCLGVNADFYRDDWGEISSVDMTCPNGELVWIHVESNPTMKQMQDSVIALCKQYCV